MQYFQKYKYQDMNQDHFRKRLQASTNGIKNNCPTTIHTFLTGRSSWSYFLRLNFYNFWIALTGSFKLRFLKITL